MICLDTNISVCRLPDGQITSTRHFLFVQPLLQKYFCFSETQISLVIRHPVPLEGRWPSSRTLGRGAVDAAVPARISDCRASLACERSHCAQTNGIEADGKIVWS
jgi:hypothetical protein